ncbi:SRPBCC domain-containing protein [Phenylobacterium sp. 20VBR1]|uniref:SRPBCC domain-containing protein n=1 Tax=Phenylobacterium glaciei TaxID=2803784 RepID=A0A941D3B0_9CAUL|nr:SRPBCC domain-containing protein [Phenylobacterium glaciei]MBR7620579.1 SRPBCC domain-containing protein [Phenylobacterium glaciei]
MTDPAIDRELTITRVMDAPASLLFEAYSRPEHIMKWFGPVGWPVTFAEIDFRVGGAFKFAMTGPSGAPNEPFGGTYLEIVQDQKIVYDNGFNGEKMMVVTVTFDEVDGKTKLTLHTLFASDEMAKMHLGGGFEEGTNSGLDQLEDLVADLASRIGGG